MKKIILLVIYSVGGLIVLTPMMIALNFSTFSLFKALVVEYLVSVFIISALSKGGKIYSLQRGRLNKYLVLLTALISVILFNLGNLVLNKPHQESLPAPIIKSKNHVKNIEFNKNINFWLKYDNVTSFSFRYPADLFKISTTKDLDCKFCIEKITLNFNPIYKTKNKEFLSIMVLKDSRIKTVKDYWALLYKEKSLNTCCMDYSYWGENEIVSYGFLDSSDDETVLVKGEYTYIFHFFKIPVEVIPGENYWALVNNFKKTLIFYK